MLAKSRPDLHCPITGWGVSARLASSRADLLQSALLGLAAGFKVSPRSRGGVVLRVRATGSHLELTEAERVIFLGRSKHGLRIALERALETLASTLSPRFAFLHAGCIELAGKAILFPGRSHAGKSTLVAEFLKRGASYLSDDLVPIDKKLRAHPFPRPISLRSMTSGAARRTSIKSLGARPGSKALPIAMVWCGTWDPLDPTPTFERRRGGAAFAELLAHAPAAQIRPDVVVPILAGLARRVPIFAGVRGHASNMVDAVLDRI